MTKKENAAAKEAAAESASTKEQTAKKTDAKKTAETVMYVGPTVPGIGIQNRVYTEIPGDAKEAINLEPEIGNLFIQVRDYPEANRMLREKKGYVYSAYVKALKLKGGKKQ